MRTWGGPNPFGSYLAYGLALAPFLVIGLAPTFVTQDGPSHVYNGAVIAAKLAGDAEAFGGVHHLPMRVLPNWGGPLAMAALVSVVPPMVADRVATLITALSVSLAALLLRRVVIGPERDRWLAPAALLTAVLLGLNVSWLMGFHGFLLGVAVGLGTLAWWWRGGVAGAMTPGWVVGLMLLWLAGFFTHAVGLALTVATILAWAVVMPQGPGRGRIRLIIVTSASLSVLLPPALAYRSLMYGSGAPIEPVWGHLAELSSPGAWVAQLGWADPISLGARSALPGRESAPGWSPLLAVPLWLGLGIGLRLVAARTRGFGEPLDCRSGRARLRLGPREWLGVTGLAWVVLGVLCPDTLGPTHGHYLPQRVTLWGALLFVGVLDPGVSAGPSPVRRPLGSLGMACLVVAGFIQCAWLVDYAGMCRSRCVSLLEAGRAIEGSGRRVATLVTGTGSRFRANPMLHLDGLVAVRGGHVLWSNYEPLHYYFPVQYRVGVARPPGAEFEAISLLDAPGERDQRCRRWQRLLRSHRDVIDVVLVWQAGPVDPALHRVPEGMTLVRAGPDRKANVASTR